MATRQDCNTPELETIPSGGRDIPLNTIPTVEDLRTMYRLFMRDSFTGYSFQFSRMAYWAIPEGGSTLLH